MISIPLRSLLSSLMILNYLPVILLVLILGKVVFIPLDADRFLWFILKWVFDLIPLHWIRFTTCISLYVYYFQRNILIKSPLLMHHIFIDFYFLNDLPWNSFDISPVFDNKTSYLIMFLHCFHRFQWNRVVFNLFQVIHLIVIPIIW
jgi:hypothetical protein